MSELKKDAELYIHTLVAIGRDEEAQFISEQLAHIAELKRQHVEELARMAGDQLARDADMYNLAEENRRLREALQHYADQKKWTEFRVSCGDIFGAEDGDQAMAFDSPDDCPWSVAAEALKP